MSLPWYACYPRDFNDGMIGLTLEERGAYITLLNLIYARGGPIPEDTWWITSQLGCTTRAWVKVRAALLLKRKLFTTELDGEPHLMNPRAEREIAERFETSKKFSDAGRRGGQKSRPKPKEINGVSEAPLKPGLSQAEACTQSQSQSSVVPPDGETTAEPSNPDPDEKAWGEAVGLLVGQGKLSADSARSFFGGLLKAHGLQARDLLGAINEAFANRTADPKSWLSGAARSRGKRQTTGPPKRVGFV